MKQTIPWDSPERMKTIFRQRARLLAREHTANRPASRGIRVLTFRLGGERYAIALSELAEVLPFQGSAPVPGAPAQFSGVINLRGELRPVIDLARVLSGNSSGDSGSVLMLRHPCGLKVDAVEDLREIRPEELVPPVQGHYIRALAAGTLALLDVDAMLSTLFATKESRPL